MRPSAPALATAATSSARPTHCMPPCTIGCSTPTSSVNRVLIMMDPLFPRRGISRAMFFGFRGQDAVPSGKCPLAGWCRSPCHPAGRTCLDRGLRLLGVGSGRHARIFQSLRLRDRNGRLEGLHGFGEFTHFGGADVDAKSPQEGREEFSDGADECWTEDEPASPYNDRGGQFPPAVRRSSRTVRRRARTARRDIRRKPAQRSVQAAKTVCVAMASSSNAVEISRMLTTPIRLKLSITGRWRIWFLFMR